MVPGKPSNQKQWLPSNFRISIGDLPRKRVTKIDAFSIKQNVVDSGKGLESTGRLEVLAPDLTTVLFGMDLHHVGIFGLDPDAPEPNANGVRRMVAELYCEEMTFESVPHPRRRIGGANPPRTTT